MRQIKEDPQALLGRESFAYRVQPGESLSRIAQRFLNDLHLFYILARYNNIKVPRNLAGGQMIRVLAKARRLRRLPAPAQPTAPRPKTTSAAPRRTAGLPAAAAAAAIAPSAADPPAPAPTAACPTLPAQNVNATRRPRSTPEARSAFAKR
jgi:hypothetical protein